MDTNRTSLSRYTRDRQLDLFARSRNQVGNEAIQVDYLNLQGAAHSLANVYDVDVMMPEWYKTVKADA